MLKLLDFKSRTEELEASDNPFAVVILGQLAANETQSKLEQRLNVRLKLVRQCLQKGWQKVDIQALYIFLENVIRLNDDLTLTYIQEKIKLEETYNMRLTTDAERLAENKGQIEGRGELFTLLMEKKFGPLPNDYQEKISQADMQTINFWSLKMLNAHNLEEIFKVWLADESQNFNFT